MGIRKKIERRGGGELARRCWKEVRDRGRERKGTSEWERERREFWEEKGLGLEEVKRRREGGGLEFGEIIRKDKESQGVERWEKIGKSSYNRWYREIKGEGIRGYLKKR